MNEAFTATQTATPEPWLRTSDVAQSLPEGTDVRTHVARGAVVNSAFQIGLYALGGCERLVLAAWLTRAQYGLLGLILAALIALSWLKQAGIGDKYIQQSEPDQERAFQKAFTLELGLSGGFFVLAVIALPLYAAAYGRPDMIVPGIAMAAMVPISAFESPSWIPYRRMQYGRQRVLTAVDPISTAVISIALTAGGLGYWGWIIGVLAGSVLGSVACVTTCPYPLRLRFDRTTLKDYTAFSWPLLGFGLCAFAMVQGTMFVANSTVGLAGVGAIGLAVNLSGMSDGVDAIVGQTIYPAVCAAAHRTELLAEVFVKSNRVALLWAIPSMVGVGLFAGDLVHFVIGDRWQSAVPVFVAVALTCGLGQVAFNWSLFLRAVNDTRPIFIAAVVEVATFLCVSVPAIIAFGLTGYAAGLAAITAVQVALRAWFMRRLFGTFSAIRQLVRAIVPTVPAAAAILSLRLASGGQASAMRAVAEVVLYSATAIVSTVVIERALVDEMWNYLRRRRRPTLSPEASSSATA